MALRITIMLDDDLHKKIRMLQAKKLKESKSSISFSYMINRILEKGIK